MDTDFVERDDREIFGTLWDVIVFGAGYAGYAAADAAARAGKSVLMVDARCDLLWESARARHPESGPFTEAFAPFGRAVACATGIAADWIDPGSAEWIANELLLEGKVKRLYFATPVSARLDGDGDRRRRPPLRRIDHSFVAVAAHRARLPAASALAHRLPFLLRLRHPRRSGHA